MDGRKVMNKCLVLEKTREGRRSGRRNQTAEQSREPTCLSIFWEKSHVFISKLPSPMLPTVPICSCCIKKKIETSVRRAPDREKQSCWGRLVFAMSEHISLMFAGSNLLHRNLLTGSVNASLGDKWNRFLRRALHLQFPHEKYDFERFLHQAVAPSEKHGGNFPEGLAAERRTAEWLRGRRGEGEGGLMWRRTSEGNAFCSAEVFNTAEVNNA